MDPRTSRAKPKKKRRAAGGPAAPPAPVPAAGDDLPIRSFDLGRWLPLLIVLAGLVLAGLCYAPALSSFFSSDDWLMLYHYGRMPLARWWEFFSPGVAWFYRPLQGLQLAVLYHLAGLNVLPYNASLFVLHLAVCALAYALVRELTGRSLFAALTTAIFTTQWVYADVLYWKSNLNTVQWAAVTLGACLSFARYLKRRDHRWLALSVFLCALDFLTKESALSTPLLLFLIWLYQEGRRTDLAPRAWPSLAARAARDLWPAVVLTVAFSIFYRLYVHDVYGLMRPDYRLASPWQVVRQALFAYHHLLLIFIADPVVLPQVPPLQRAVLWLATYVLVLPFLLVLWGWRARDRVLLFGTGWIFCSSVPVVLLTAFHSSRYYYLPALGASLILARVLERGSAAAGRSARWDWLLRVGLGALAAYALVINLVVIVFLVTNDQVESEVGRAVYNLLREQRASIPRGSIIIVRNIHDTLFTNGIGVREMVRFALDDPTADGVPDAHLSEPRRIALLNPQAAVFEIDLAGKPGLRRVAVPPWRARGP